MRNWGSIRAGSEMGAVAVPVVGIRAGARSVSKMKTVAGCVACSRGRSLAWL